MNPPMRAAARALPVGAQAGAFGFVCALAGGAVLLSAAKLQVLDLGAGASPATVFETIVLIGLGVLGAPVDVGGIEVMVLPLGALALVCAGIASVVQRAFVRGDPRTGADEHALRAEKGASRLGAAAGSALAFAFLCGLAAQFFRLGEGAGEVAVAPGGAALAGALWGAVAALAGAWRADRRERDPGHRSALRRLLDSVRGPSDARRWLPLREGMRLALWLMLAALAGLAVFAFARVFFRSGTPLGALGSLVHALAFAPNLAVAGGALALGASMEAGFGGLAADAVPTYSLLDWAGGPTPPAAWLLPLVPLGCTVAMGIRLARLQPLTHAEGTGSTSAAGSIASTALAFSATLALVAFAGEARAGVVEDQGFVRVAADALEVLVLGLGWAAVGLSIGWGIGRAGDHDTR